LRSRDACYDFGVRRATAIVALFVGVATAAADPAGDLVQTVPTTKSRAELSQFLVGRGEKLAKAHDFAHAIPIYAALALACGPASPEQKQLAQLWADAKQTTDAAEAWKAFAAATSDPDERARAQVEAQRLAAAPDPYADKLALVGDDADAKRVFELGRAAFRAKHFGDALVYFHLGSALAPDLPGFLRELGATYEQLGASPQRREFYRRYLVQRPFGANADAVRAELAKDKDALGTLLVSSSLPCTEMWLNAERIVGKLPDKGLIVAPGSYKGLCFNPKFEIALFEYATVEAGKPTTMQFQWAVVVNQLDHPLGRIALENPKEAGTMIDLGITSPEVGVAVAPDRRRLKMVLKDDSGVRTEERMVQIEPGQRLVVKW